MKEELVWEAEKSHGGVLFLLVLVLTKAVIGGESVADAVGDYSGKGVERSLLP